MLKKYLLITIMVLTLQPLAQAKVSPIALGFFPGFQFPPSDFTVAGLRASVFWGRHRNMYGIDLGVVGNITEQDFTGLGLAGIFNFTHGSTSILGFQVAGGANVNTNKTSVLGIQVAGLFNNNQAASSIYGIQAAIAGNIQQHTKVYGISVGLYNKALEVYGLQVGLVNIARSLHGFQIGLINFHETGVFAVCPFINVGF